MKKEQLAINQYKDQIVETVKNNPVVVIEAPTGSGKTTQIPQILFNAGLNEQGRIGVTQPRRIAAFAVSNRIAYEMDVELGRLVGYKMRFDDMTSIHTQIKIMTDGILLEELRSDPGLLKYSIIMVDEAHERSLNIDFILGLLKEILKHRKDFKVVVSSATINAKLFSRFFNNAPIISVKTKPYPVGIEYLPLEKKDNPELLQQKIIDIIASLEEREVKGDVLIFLPGEQSIKDCCERIRVLNVNNNFSMVILPLYARLSHEDQKRVFDEFLNKRKIVIATNIAETSITIDGIVHVIDPGYSKLNYYNPRTFTAFLESKPISKASCDQRMGRAGRTAPGVVYRLYSQGDYINRDEYTKEEIYRTDLSEVVLRMGDLGISHYSEFDFISPPKKGAILSAIETLVFIGALNDNQRLTDIGKKMVDFPLEPRLSRILVESVLKYPKVANNVLIILSFLSAKSPFLYPHGEEIESRQAQKKFAVKGGDFFSWINLFNQYKKAKDKEKFCKTNYIDERTINEIINIHSQLKDMLKDRNYSIKDKFDYNNIIRSICTGLKQYICKKDIKKRNTYYSVTEKDIRIHPGSFLFGQTPEWIIGGEIVNTGRTYIRTASPIPEEIIKKDFSDAYLSITKRSFSKKKFLREESTRIKSKYSKDEKVYILDKYFEFHREKNGRFLYVPYNIIIQLKNKKEKIMEMNFGNLKAKLVFKGKIILKDSLNSLVRYFDKIDLDNGINTKWPKNQFFLYPDDWVGILRYIKLLLMPTLSQSNSTHTGFLCLNSVEDNVYKYNLERDFFYALETSLETMEKIFDSSIIAWNEKEKAVMESVHHKLINLSEEMEV